MGSLIAATLVSLGWCLLALRLGPRLGYLDVPDDPALKTHTRPAVPLGGVGVFLAIHAAAVVGDRFDPVLLAASGMMLVLGLVDDRRGLTPQMRLGVELAAAVVLVLGVTGPDADPLTIALGLLLVVVTVNAVNLFDGLDGLAGSVGLVTALGLAWLAAGRGGDPWGSLELAAALVGFLVLGWHPARVFLGDAGAYVIGITLSHAVLSISPQGGFQLVLTSAVLGAFAVDLAVTLTRRMLHRTPLFAGDRSHVYDQLRDGGFSVPGVVALAAGFQAAFTVLVVAVDRSLPAWQGVVVLATVGLVVLAGLARQGFLRAGRP